MFSSIDQLTTVVSGASMAFLPHLEPVAANLYFHLVLRFDGTPLTNEQEARLKKYVACFVDKKGGSLPAISFAKNRVHVLVGLSPFCAPGTFIREFKLLSASFAQRKTGAADFVWQQKHDAFTVSLSQVERVCSYIRRQKMLDRQESYAASWNRLASQELY
jgi:REP element-mobilizing transposase RayT